MRFLICGLGSIGRRHLSNLRALGEEDVVLYRTGKSTMPDEELAHLPAEDDLATALERWQPQAALVTNPTALHLEVALPAARAGLHLFLEKPLSDSMAGVDQLQEIVSAQELKALVGFQFRFHPGLQRARGLLREGAIGRPLTACAHWGEYLPAWHPWEDYRGSYSARSDLGGGVALTLCHPFDYLLWLLGPVETVAAEVTTSGALDIEVEDQLDAVLRHRNGTVSRVHLNYHQRPMRHDLEVVGTEGTLRWDAVDSILHWWSVESGSWQRESPPEGFERNELFLAEMRNFTEYLRDAAQPACTLAEGVEALALTLAALEAGSTGERVQLVGKVEA